MKHILLLALALTASADAARGDCFAIFADTPGYTCYLNTLAELPGNNTAYVIHKLNAGSTASQFKVLDKSGLFPTTQQTPYLALGTWNTDLSLAYGGCVIGEHVLMTLNFLWFGEPMTGCTHTLDVVAAPTSPIPGSIAVVDCAVPFGNIVVGYGGWSFYVRSDSQTCFQGCGCDDFHTPVDAATWGSVKALYR
jgi:hypothetical protein